MLPLIFTGKGASPLGSETLWRGINCQGVGKTITLLLPGEIFKLPQRHRHGVFHHQLKARNKHNLSESEGLINYLGEGMYGPICTHTRG